MNFIPPHSMRQKDSAGPVEVISARAYHFRRAYHRERDTVRWGDRSCCAAHTRPQNQSSKRAARRAPALEHIYIYIKRELRFSGGWPTKGLYIGSRALI